MTILERRQRLQVRRRFLSTVAPSKTSLSSTQLSSLLRWRKPPPPLTVPVTTTTTTTTSNSNSTGTFTSSKNRTTTTSTAMSKLLWKMKRDYRKRRVVAMSGSNKKSRNNNNDMATKLYMDRTTLAVMKLEVQQLLRHDEILQRTTSPLSMVNALLGSKHLLNVYAEEEEAAIGVSSFSSSKALLYSNENDSHPAPLVVRRFGGVPLLSRSRGGSYLATANTSTQRRYDFVNTLNQLQQLVVSSSSSSSNDNKSIASWQDAMAILSKVLYFPLDNDDDDDVESNSAISSLIVKEPDGTSALTTTNETFTSPSIHHSTDPRTEMFLQRLRDIRIEEMSPPGLRLSQHKWLDIATTALQSNSSRHQDDPVNEEEALVHHVATPLFRDLTDEEQDRLDRIMEQGAGTDIVARTDDDTDSVQRSNLRTLLPYEWVNDEVIHYYLSLLQQRDEQLCRRANSSANEKKRTHFFKSFFMTKLLDEGNINPALDGVYNYNNVKRWSKKVPGTYRSRSVLVSPCFFSVVERYHSPLQLLGLFILSPSLSRARSL